MLVKGNINGDVYKKLLDYAFSKCDVISLTRYCNQHSQQSNAIMKIILSKSHYTKSDIVNNYSDQLIEEIYNDFLDNPVIFDDEFKRKYEPNGREEVRRNMDGQIYLDNRRACIWHALGFTVYNELGNRWLKLYKNQIIFSKKNILNDNLFHSMVYYIKLDKHMEQEILNKKSIYNWCFPTSLEDICFYKNGYCWLYSVAHEEMCFIYCETEEEYKYLKSIGIEFADDQFVPTPKEQLIYEEY